jgi:hypothetical protein
VRERRKKQWKTGNGKPEMENGSIPGAELLI